MDNNDGWPCSTRAGGYLYCSFLLLILLRPISAISPYPPLQCHSPSQPSTSGSIALWCHALLVPNAPLLGLQSQHHVGWRRRRGRERKLATRLEVISHMLLPGLAEGDYSWLPFWQSSTSFVGCSTVSHAYVTRCVVVSGAFCRGKKSCRLTWPGLLMSLPCLRLVACTEQVSWYFGHTTATM